MKPDREGVLQAIRENGGSMGYRDLASLFDIDRLRKKGFAAVLDRMVASGELVVLGGQRYSLADGEGTVTGKLAMHRDGYGFVTPDVGGSDIFVPARGLRGNLHGDIVEVAVVAQPGGKREGRVLKTIERGLKRIIGRYELLRGFGRVMSDDPRVSQEVIIPAKHAANAVNGQVVVAEITAYPLERKPAMGRIVEVLGWPDDPDVEVQTVIRKYELPNKFDKATLSEARSVGVIAEADLAGRTDLRGLTIVTIDGETARDFDDAVSVRREADGKVRLWVSIADVSHYVRPGSLLDREAYLRGTSVYFPDRCLPMLPETLSNGICSLNPQEDRLTLTAEMVFDKGGNRVDQAFYQSVIRSAARLTYTQVAEVLEEQKPETVKALAAVVDDLKLMEELARRLMELRRTRGSLDFDLPEPEIIIDITTGTTVSIARSTRNIAHRLIEEFMLAANEAVAGHLEQSGIPSLYRVHEPPVPEKIQAFSELAAGFGHHLVTEEGRVTGSELQRLLDGAIGKPEELMLNRVLLRSMKQARYAAENLGHFGLAAKTYTHFTSPIRRYPDLVVHRILKLKLAGNIAESTREELENTLPETGIHTSKRERVAMEAERELVELKRLQFMKQKVGEEFEGFIIGVTTSGFFVELNEFFVEGMVPVTGLKDDYYIHAEKQHALVGANTRRMFRIGDRVKVLVAAVSLEQRQIEFALLDHIPLQQTDAGWELDLPKPKRVAGKWPDARRGREGGRPTDKKAGKKTGNKKMAGNRKGRGKRR
ncbi:ribonuclease R [Geobacter pelophilus]|uniref:Ribonuclease R n=1 Tax=Geoanaerobacter pelophilus TaxID=60036 RepID=A0AAW4L4V6_9BACT|nr:ribonuclease R [Geoanaerobacter pelophilus]MBT0664565.1 ribonuclease R [Geoanaerobacter pelophilus]